MPRKIVNFAMKFNLISVKCPVLNCLMNRLNNLIIKKVILTGYVGLMPIRRVL